LELVRKLRLVRSRRPSTRKLEITIPIVEVIKLSSKKSEKPTKFSLTPRSVIYTTREVLRP